MTLDPKPIWLDELPYPVIIGTNLEQQLREFLERRGNERVAMVCDVNVLEHAQRIAKAIPSKIRVEPFTLGEKRKRLKTVEHVLTHLAEIGADRKTVLIGVGGGVAGDLFGFVASCYMRGIPFVNIATSVVAMVDASIGGKTGVDLAAGKNLAGAFSDPQAVFAAIDTLSTLPVRQMREGLGEVVKHAVIDGEAMVTRLEGLVGTPLAEWPWQELVAESMRLKAGIINEDRLEAGRREVLNLGHTFAHGLEYATNYRLSHGAAVAIGLRGAGLLAQELAGFSAPEHQRMLRLLDDLRLPLFDDRCEVKDVLTGMAADKKNRDGHMRFVLPQTFGQVDHGITAGTTQVRTVIKRLLREPKPDELGGLR